MFSEMTQVLAAVSIAFLGGTACYIMERIGMEGEAKSLQKIVTAVLGLIFLRYAIEMFFAIQTFSRY